MCKGPEEAAREQRWLVQTKMRSGKSNQRKELFVQIRLGTLFDFLDEFELSLEKYVVNRSIPSRQKAGGLAFESHRRPGDLSAEIDFAENLDIK